MEEALSFLIGILGNMSSLLVFLAPISTFWRIFKMGTTEDFDSFPYVSFLLNGSLWTYYGIVKPGAYLVATINGFCAVAQIIYLSFFFAFAPPKMKVKTAVLVAVLNVAFPVAAIAFTMLELQGEVRINCIGFICAALSIIACGSPLSSMRMVLKTRSVEYMPLNLSVALFLNAAIWTLYGFVTPDFFLLVPNGTGVILGMFQIMIYVIFKEAKPLKCEAGALEEGWQHQPLIVPADDKSAGNEAKILVWQHQPLILPADEPLIVPADDKSAGNEAKILVWQNQPLIVPADEPLIVPADDKSADNEAKILVWQHQPVIVPADDKSAGNEAKILVWQHQPLILPADDRSAGNEAKILLVC